MGHLASIYFDDNDLIVRSDVAKSQLDEIIDPLIIDPPPIVDPPIIDPPLPPPPKLMTRYHGTVSLDPQRVNKEMGVIVEELIQRLTSLTDTDVEITIEISANRLAGFEDATVRTINENSQTLKFKNHGFEE
jgi:hypothetical protein